MSRAWAMNAVLILAGCTSSQLGGGSLDQLSPGDLDGRVDATAARADAGPSAGSDAALQRDAAPKADAALQRDAAPKADAALQRDAAPKADAALQRDVAPSDGRILDPAMSAAQAAAAAAAASTAGYARLAAMQAAHKAWAIPSRPDLVATATNALSSGLKSGGLTDNTAALQALLKALPAGSVLYFPAGTYRIDGPIWIDKPITIFGQSGTILDCSKTAQSVVFHLNESASAPPTLSGLTLTGLVIEGPGIETLPVIIRGKYLQDARFSYLKLHNIGTTAISVYFSTDVIVEDSVFDNVFRTGEGYGVAVCDRSDRVLIRNNFFVTKGRHSVTTGTANPSLPVTDYVRQVIFENNYCENTQSFGSAADTHIQTIGPFIVRNNVFYNCQHGVRLRGGYGEIYDNVVIGTSTVQVGIYVYDVTQAPNSFDTKLNKIERNTILGTLADGIICANSNDEVRNNILTGSGGKYGFYVDGEYYTPTLIRFEQNIIKGYATPISLYQAGSNVQQLNNWLL